MCCDTMLVGRERQEIEVEVKNLAESKIDQEELIDQVLEETGTELEYVEDVVHDLLREGTLFEPEIGYLKRLDR